MAGPAFTHPDDIRPFGRMVNSFSDAAKTLAGSMETLGFTQEDILPIVGRGRYNTLEAQGYIIYGPQATADARKNMQGLFGAFYYVHKPELQLSQQAPVLLGKAGFRLVAHRPDGTQAQFPLERVGFDFIPRQGYSNPGQITVRSDVEAVQPDGNTATLAVGTVLTRGRKWQRENNAPLYGIVDAQGKAMDEQSAALMLWGHLGSMGFKANGQGTPRYNTIQQDGTDDDFAAENAMIKWMKAVRLDHGVDLMPQFKGFVASARESLLAKPELLASFAAAIDLAGRAEAHHRAVSAPPADHPHKHLEFRLGRLAEVKNPLLEAAAMLDLPLPRAQDAPDHAAQAALAEGKLAAARQTIHASKQAERRRILDFEWREYLSQYEDPFNARWLSGGGNTLRNLDRGSARLLKLIGEDGETARHIAELTGQKLEETGRVKIVRELAKMAQFIDQTRLDTQSVRSYPLLQDSGRAAAFSAAMEEGRAALNSLLRSVKEREPIDGLAGKTARIGKAYEQLNLLYGSPAGLKPAPEPAATPPAAAKHLNAGQLVQQRRAQAQANRTVKLHTRALRGDAPSHWKEKRGATFERFLSFMEAVGHDESRWMSLYRDTSALTGNAAATQDTAFAARLEAERAAAPEAVTVSNARG